MKRSLTFPFHIGDLGAPATSPRTLAVRQQLEQLLFTIPGERVNRPTFGCGVQRLVFGGCSPESHRQRAVTPAVGPPGSC